MNTMTITEFLTARLDEAEAAAKTCAEVYPGPWELTDRGWIARIRADEPHFRTVAELEQHESIDGWLGDRLDHIARHDPARVLADIAAKRRIVERFGEWVGGTHDTSEDEGAWEIADDHAWATLYDLALPYSDHPDYREEWKP